MANKMSTELDRESNDELFTRLCANEALRAEASLEQKNFSVPYAGREMSLEEKVSGVRRSVALLVG